MKTVELKETVALKGSADVLVCGGGVAGVAAAISAARSGKSVILFEKTVILGGLATTGLVNFFVPMCNGRGTLIIKGLAEELFDLSAKYSYDTIPEDWKNGEPGQGKTLERYVNRYDPNIFALALTNLLNELGVKIMFDTVIVKPVMNGGHCDGVIVENKSGREYYEGKIIVDATGDADVFARAGAPVVQGKNYHTYYCHAATLESCKKAVDKNNIAYLRTGYNGGRANLYGEKHPEGKPYWKGTDGEDVTKYITENQIEMFENIKDIDRNTRTILMLPTMPQFRTTRHLEGDCTLQGEDTYRHFEDSIGTICDFERRDFLYEVPYRTLVKTGFDNLIAAGRVAAAEGWAWDCLRVIPPAILTGQAAGNAAVQALDTDKAVYDVDVHTLQATLALQGVMIHFDDALVPEVSDTTRVDVGEN